MTEVLTSQDNVLSFGHLKTHLGGNSEKMSTFMHPCVDVFMCTRVTVPQSLRGAEIEGKDMNG